MSNQSIQKKYESKLRNIGFEYLIKCLFNENYTVDELYRETAAMKEPISKTDLEFIHKNYKVYIPKITITSEIKELSKDEIFTRAKELVECYKELKIIYLRVSTKNEGQEETDQLPDIVKTFNLDIEKCLVITAKESAYQEKKDKTRRFNYIYDLLKENKQSTVKIYLWDLDRAYRNRERLANFFQVTKEHKADVFSYNQKFINDIYGINLPLGLDWLKYFIVGLFINFLGWIAEDESKRKGNRLKKSLTSKNGKFYTNKGNIFGRKLVKKIINKGKDNEQKIYFSLDEISKINNIILSLHSKGNSIKRIKDLFEAKKDIKLSVGYIHKTINS